MSFGLSADGFNRKRLADIKTELEEALKLIFGDNIDLAPQSNFGQFVGIMSERLAISWERSENVYNSQYPSTAQGVQLSNVVMYNGIERQEATNSTATVTISGTNGTLIPAGSIVSVVSTNAFFITNQEVTIAGGAVDVAVTAQVVGAIEAAAGTLTQIETPIFGWVSVTNVADASVGREEETDTALRERRELSTQALGNNLVDSLFGQLLNIDGVEDALVLDNKTDIIDANGIPPHQFLSVVLGGLNADIANAIWNNTPQGINSHGAITEVITDAQGFPQDVKFTRPDDVLIYFKVDITTNGSFPASGEEDIKTAIVAYGIGNFKISDDVIRSEFYTPINTIPGIQSIDLRIGLSSSPTGTSNLTIDVDEISRYSTVRVEVNVV